jgi:hypothetical protein
MLEFKSWEQNDKFRSFMDDKIEDHQSLNDEGDEKGQE